MANLTRKRSKLIRTALDGPNPPLMGHISRAWLKIMMNESQLVGNLPGESEEGRVGVPGFVSLEALVTSHPRGRTLCPAREEAKDAAEVIRHLVISNQDLLHGLGQRHAGKHLRELRGWRHLGLLRAVLHLIRHGL